MNLANTAWTAADTELALAEGWMVFNDNEIQRDDEAGVFDSDADALLHVRHCAEQGSRTHQLALALHDSAAKH